ncbi:MAG: hypothetical protein ACOY3J_06450, partial [Bacillota bacterium]
AQARMNAMNNYTKNRMDIQSNYGQRIQDALQSTISARQAQWQEEQKNAREAADRAAEDERARLARENALKIAQQQAQRAATNAVQSNQQEALKQKQAQILREIQAKAFSYPPDQALDFVNQNAGSIIAEVGLDEYNKLVKAVIEAKYRSIGQYGY